MQNQDFDIARLFAGFLAGNLTGQQQQDLDEWKAASAENRALFEKVCQGDNFRELNQMATRFDREGAWKKLENNFQPEKRVTLRHWIAWAAVFVLPLCICYILLRQVTHEEDKQLQQITVGLPGAAKAVLTMADGSAIELHGDRDFELQEKDGTRINKDSATLVYNTGGAQQGEKMIYNKIETPRGGEYSLLLSDGSMVWLNAMTTLSFPVHFTGDTREVELTGEAYFEVKKDTRPFIVKTKDIQVQVLGTQFNVAAYPDDNDVKTTLVQGSVKVNAGQGASTVILKPSQQAVFCKNSGELSATDVNVSEFIAWKNGKFDFRDWRLEEMMDYLSRWYDIEVFYQNEKLKDMRFGCYINRYSEIRPILEFLEKTGKVNVSLKGKTVLFTLK